MSRAQSKPKRKRGLELMIPSLLTCAIVFIITAALLHLAFVCSRQAAGKHQRPLLPSALLLPASLCPPNFAPCTATLTRSSSCSCPPPRRQTLPPRRRPLQGDRQVPQASINTHQANRHKQGSSLQLPTCDAPEGRSSQHRLFYREQAQVV